MRGLFVTFEGVDGSGKSTQMRLLREYLESQGFPVEMTREPGGCGIAEQIRSILLDKKNTEMNPYTEAFLYAAARSQLVSETIVPAMDAGAIVLCDRFLDSSLAYQGYGRDLGMDTVEEINRCAVRGLQPDVTFFIDVQPDRAFERKGGHRTRDRVEEGGDKFYRRLYEGYLTLASRAPGRIIRIDASGQRDETQRKVRAAMDEVLGARGFKSA